MSNRDDALARHRTAEGLLRELHGELESLPDRISNASDDDGPILKIINAGLEQAIDCLGRAVSALKTRVR